MRKQTFFACSVLLAVLIALSGCSTAKHVAVKPGQKSLAFQATTTDGQPVNFPGDYKGKIVLLDFWATWCSDCRAELPNVVAAYDQYHSQGLEILGVSLDKEDMAQKLAAFTRENKMPWREIYDGNYWKTRIALQYKIHWIPTAFLVDGDTGLVLASEDGAHATNLAPAIEKALAAKARH